MTKKISQLPAATSVDTNDEFVINQDGTTKKLTTANQWQFANVNIDGGTIDGTAVNATNLAYTGTLTGGTGVVNLGSGQVVKDANGNIGVGLTPSAWRTADDLQAIEIGPSFGLYSNDANNAYFANNWFLDAGATIRYKNTGTAQVFGAESGNFIWQNAPSGTAGEPLTFQERMRIDSSGHAIIPAGVTLGTSAGVFNAAKTLDDYEEGTWTPTLPNGGTISSLGSTVANYTKIGRQVTVSAYVSISSVPNNTNRFEIGGLPFTLGALSINPYGSGSISYSATAITSDLGGPLAEQNSSVLYFHFLSGSAAFFQNNDVNSKSLAFLIFSYTYFAP